MTKQTKELNQFIRKKITDADGHISFADFMELALYTPQIGYYSANRPKFGRGGDFVTAPEISPLFAKCMANQFHQILDKLGGGDILEIGAGSGVFAKEVLLALEQKNNLPKHYYIYEKSDSLRQSQQLFLQESCPHLTPLIHWLEQLPNFKINGIIFANEVMDAMPVHIFQIKNKKILECGVTRQKNQFAWQTREPSEQLKEKIHFLQAQYELPDEYQSEINVNLPSWINGLSEILNDGAILLIDYGYGRKEYYHPDRTQGTLMCFYQHQASDNPFQYVGEQDITAHVDFTTVVESGIDAGLELAGYTTQAAFLLASGLLDLNNPTTHVLQYKHNQEIKRLTLPSEMGEIVKVIGFNKNIDLSWTGFNFYDRRHDL